MNSHPGLAFLKEAPDFHSRYITTVCLNYTPLHFVVKHGNGIISKIRLSIVFQVIQRVFYNVNRSWTGKITCSELRKSNFLQVFIHILCIFFLNLNRCIITISLNFLDSKTSNMFFFFSFQKIIMKSHQYGNAY